MENYQKIQVQNEKFQSAESTYEAGVNQFSDLVSLPTIDISSVYLCSLMRVCFVSLKRQVKSSSRASLVPSSLTRCQKPARLACRLLGPQMIMTGEPQD